MKSISLKSIESFLLPISKKVNYQRLLCILTLCYAIRFFWSLSTIPDFRFISASLVLFSYFLILAGIILIVLKNKDIGMIYKPRQILMMLIAVFIMAMINIYFRYSYFNITFLIFIFCLLALQEIQIIDYFRFLGFSLLGILVFLMILSLSGIIENRIIEGRHCLGLTNYNMGFYLLNSGALILFFEQKKRFFLIKIGVLLVLNLIIFFFTNTRLPLVVNFCLLAFLISVRKIKIHFDLVPWSKILPWFFLGIFLISLVLVLIYSPDNTVMRAVDGLLTGRLKMQNRYVHSLGISLLIRPEYYGIRYVNGIPNPFYIDSGFMDLLLRFGLLICTLIIAYYSFLMKKAARSNNGDLVVWLVCVGLFNLINTSFFNIFLDASFLSILLFDDWLQASCDKEKGWVKILQYIGKIKRLFNEFKVRYFGYTSSMFNELQAIPFSPSSVTSLKARMNLVIPDINPSRMYGGIKTALDFFMVLIEQSGFEGRILFEQPIDEEITNCYREWEICNSSADTSSRLSMCSLADLPAEALIPVRRNDYFVTTTWKSHFRTASVLDLQQSVFSQSNPLIYFIQDFEPGFYPWSSNYFLAESTYHTPRTIAVVNSVELHQYLSDGNYQFEAVFTFKPVLNRHLAAYREQAKKSVRKNQIIFYGRPHNPRNAFSLIVQSINLFIERYPDLAKEWTFISIGAPIKKIILSDGRQLKTFGKMSLSDYAKVLSESKLGISLMCSPHPSYPPIEMAAFGVKTITNSFPEKNLTNFSKNIISLEYVDFDCLSTAIFEAVNSDLTPDFSSINEDFLSESVDFGVIVQEILSLLTTSVKTEKTAGKY